MNIKCPFKIGDVVRFTPSERTLGLYQDIGGFEIQVSCEYEIKEIKNDIYLYFEGGIGGWPWNEFVLIRNRVEKEDC